jgi:AcrR family transcriptional regulator
MGRIKKIIGRDLVIDKTLSIIEARGYRCFSTRSLAAELGISVMTLYNYFRNREAIICAALNEGRQRFMRETAAAIAARDGGDLGLSIYRFLSEELLAFAIAKPQLFVFLFGDIDPDFIAGPDSAAGRQGLLYDLQAARIADPLRAEGFRRAAFLYQVLVHRLILVATRGSLGMGPGECRSLAAEAFALLLEPYAQDLRGSPSLADLLGGQDLESRIAALVSVNDGGAAAPDPRP